MVIMWTAFGLKSENPILMRNFHKKNQFAYLKPSFHLRFRQIQCIGEMATLFNTQIFVNLQMSKLSEGK